LAYSDYGVNGILTSSFTFTEEVTVPKQTPGRRPAKSSETTSQLGARLRAARRDKGMTLRDVFEATNVSITYLSDLERGVLSNPTLDKVKLIAGALGVTVEDLLGSGDNAGLRDEPALPAPLQALAASPQFLEATEADARTWRTTPEALQRAWLDSLQRISVDGRRPQSMMDYLFIFEAIRRAIGK
jgi:transcriptional regulator with XRE-family HTH domain